MNYLRPYHFISNYNKKELESLNNKINIIYRNYKDPIKESVIIKVKSECKKSRKKLFLSNNIKMAIKLYKLNCLNNINTKNNFCSRYNEIITENLFS